MKTWIPADSNEDMEFAQQFTANPVLGHVPLKQLDASDCRRELKPDCDEKHDATKKGSKDYIKDVANSMVRPGIVPRIIVDRESDGSFFLRDGHHRVTAARDLGYTHAPAIIIPPSGE